MEEEGSLAAALLVSGAFRSVGVAAPRHPYLPAPPLAFLVEVLGFLPPPLLPGPLSPIVKPLRYGRNAHVRVISIVNSAGKRFMSLVHVVSIPVPQHARYPSRKAP